MGTAAALLKQQIEAQLERRIPAALSPMCRPETVRMALADARLNQLLGGGVPAGAITEVYGETCSGRTSFALSLTSAATARGSVAAWIDVADALDPETAAMCGVDLKRLLWVRCSEHRGVERKTAANEVPQHASGWAAGCMDPQPSRTATAGAPNLIAANHAPRPVGNGGCGSPHPRGEGRGMAEAIDRLLQSQPRSAAVKDRRERRSIGTPGAPNRDLRAAVDGWSQVPVSHNTATVQDKAHAFPAGRPALQPAPKAGGPACGSLFPRDIPDSALAFPNASPYREEQVATDRQPSRRAAQRRTGEPQSRPKAHSAMHGLDAPVVAKDSPFTQDNWAPLDQALRVVDLLLQAGGFSLIVLDLGSVPANMVWRIPLATWFRFRAGCERSRASLLVVSQHACARASADLAIAMEFRGLKSEGSTVAVGSEFRLELEQQRRGSAPDRRSIAHTRIVPFGKPVRSEAANTWSAASCWKVGA